MNYLYIGVGGALGAILRSLIGNVLPHTSFPLQILVVNVLGCLMMGLLIEVLALYWQASMTLRYFLVPGFLGGFTTFSAFALEFGLLYEKGLTFQAIVYVVTSVILSLFAFFLGLKLVRIFS